MYAVVCDHKDVAECSKAAYNVSRLLYEPHIYKALCDDYKDLYCAHILLREIEDGERIVITVYDGNIAGCIHGTLRDGVFYCHLLFKRKVDAVKACLLCEDAFKEYCKNNKMRFYKTKGNICVLNRAAIRCAKKYGSEIKAVGDVFMWYNGRPEKCITFEKEVF
jgi:hypothetical protein